MKIGSHVSNSGIKMLIGSVEEAISYDANCMMVYLGAPQTTLRKKVEEQRGSEALELANRFGIKTEDIIVHAPYIVNLAQSDDEKHLFAVSFLSNEMKMMDKIGLKYMVLHPGAHVGKGASYGINRIASGINKILSMTSNDSTVILLETMAGKGTECGKDFYEIASIINLIENKDRIGVCLDTCHIFDSGYNIVNNYDNVLKEFDSIIGFEYLKVIHLNDSKNILGSKKDRHENIGYGNIGFDTLMKFASDYRFEAIPKILETPYVSDGNMSYPIYKEEIEMLRNGKFSSTKKVV